MTFLTAFSERYSEFAVLLRKRRERLHLLISHSRAKRNEAKTPAAPQLHFHRDGNLWLCALAQRAYMQDMAMLNDTTALDRAEKTHLARIVFFVFLLTFMLARILVFLIMSRRIPDLYLYVGGNHLHHLNYGIFLLAGLGAFFLFGKPEGRSLQAAAVVYGLGMALTFDEFGMWVRLGGG